MDAALAARFDAKYIPEPNSGCWLWIGGSWSKDGYGLLKAGENNRPAHRLSYLRFKGPIPEGMCVCHHCDIRSCVNPDHLFLGTIAENQADMAHKGRSLQGERHHKAKLTVADVLAIRASTVSLQATADQYGVGKTTIHKIRSRQTWKHLSAPQEPLPPKGGANG